ncbi:MAG TPA: rhomboid family intramembrane serine protease [Myxococcales bacterium]|nr:rhomboid family intramembrane serine protease [Myxococcales bacterium]
MSEVDPLGGLGRGPEAPRAESPEREPAQPRERHRPPPAPTTLVLLGLLGAMFLAEIAVGGKLGNDSLALFRLGALSAAAVLDGDWWRLGSYAFLHAGPVHLLVNAYALWILMRPLEGLFGAASALGIFSATAIIGGAASVASALYFRHSPWQPAVGASGGIFGLFGAHVALYWRLRTRLSPEARRGAGRTLLVNLLINLALAVGAVAVGFPLDNAAHAGGFLSGILLGLIAPAHVLAPRPWTRPALIALVGASLALAAMEGAAVARAVHPHSRELQGEGIAATVPWSLVPGGEGHARSVEGYDVYLGRVEGTLSGGHPVALANGTWTELAVQNGEGVDIRVLLRREGDANLVVQAWCSISDCATDERDRIAQEVAASAHATR